MNFEMDRNFLSARARNNLLSYTQICQLNNWNCYENEEQTSLWILT